MVFRFIFILGIFFGAASAHTNPLSDHLDIMLAGTEVVPVDCPTPGMGVAHARGCFIFSPDKYNHNPLAFLYIWEELVGKQEGWYTFDNEMYMTSSSGITSIKFGYDDEEGTVVVYMVEAGYGNIIEIGAAFRQ